MFVLSLGPLAQKPGLEPTSLRAFRLLKLQRPAELVTFDLLGRCKSAKTALSS